MLGQGLLYKVRAMNTKRGFTLIELMITVAVVAIVLAIGVPSFQEMMRNNRAATHMNGIIGALNLARSEAIKRGRRVSLCPSSDQAGCSGSDWAKGWIVFVDTATADGSVAVGQVLRVNEALVGDPTFTGPANIRYRPTGTMIPTNSEQFNYTLYTVKRRVCVSPVGRPSVDKETTSCP